MAEQSVQTVLFPTLFAKPLVATFDTPHQSSDGGAILLKAIDDELGLTARLAACLPEPRQAGKIAHDLPTLIRQRCFGLACGYADANDAALLRDDPIHKLLVGRDPVAGNALASQPTLSRGDRRGDPGTCPACLSGGPGVSRSRSPRRGPRGNDRKQGRAGKRGQARSRQSASPWFLSQPRTRG